MEDIKNGKSEDCFAAHLYLKREEYGLTDNEAMFAGKYPGSVFLSLVHTVPCLGNNLYFPRLIPPCIQSPSRISIYPLSPTFIPSPSFFISLLLVHLTPALNVIEGGSDTTRATLNVFITAMAGDPSFLNRARKHLDSVLGDAGRLPTFEDQEKLPIINACVKEVLRWMPLASTGTFVPETLLPSLKLLSSFFPSYSCFRPFIN